ncbi:transposase [Streptomyces sp. NPDC085929]|uniref:transposase n=1 Tax=Streptomyces sp. NPDC085929 TaxID=3365739 RepID=UPI0037D21E43
MGNTRNGQRAMKVMTEVGPVVVQVPRDRLGTFAPQLLPKYARRTGALDDMVLSLTATGLTTGEIVAHLAEVYGVTTSPVVFRPASSVHHGITPAPNETAVIRMIT